MKPNKINSKTKKAIREAFKQIPDEREGCICVAVKNQGTPYSLVTYSPQHWDQCKDALIENNKEVIIIHEPK